jgi:hypothetical protein
MANNMAGRKIVPRCDGPAREKFGKFGAARRRKQASQESRISPGFLASETKRG